MKKFFTVAGMGLIVSAALLAAPAMAGGVVDWSVTIGAPYAPVYAQPVYPQPVYVPPVVYTEPPVVYVRPRPVYVQPRPVYVENPGYVVYGQPYYGHRRHEWREWHDRGEHRGHHGHHGDDA